MRGGSIPATADRRPWGRAALWLVILGSVFFASYLGSLEIVSRRTQVPALVFDWERHIPFLAWTIVPYWSIDLFYGLSLFLCASRDELGRLVRRLLCAQAVAVAIFLVAPLRLTVFPPADTGVFAPLFDALAGFIDKPYNMAPSLHIALLVILWEHFARHLPRRWHPAMHLWAVLIGVSVLTARQHHFFDVPTGAALGLLCLWAWPAEGASPLSAVRLRHDHRALRLSGLYLAGASICITAAALAGGAALWLLWPALSLALVAAAFGLIGPVAFQKKRDGRISLAARVLLWPYLIAARANALLWNRNAPPSLIAPGVLVGPVPRRAPEATVVIDLAAEISAPRGARDWLALPMLDLVAPEPAELMQAAEEVERALRRARATGRRVLICCALGRSRSAAVAVLWLAAHGGAADVDRAVATLRQGRPQIALGEAEIAAIRLAQGEIRADAAMQGLRRCAQTGQEAIAG